MSNFGVDPIPAPVRALAALFGDDLAEVKFPDVDATTVTTLLARVDSQHAEVTRLEEELTRARALLESSRDELVRVAARAHAYARVYAEDDAALSARVDAITLPRARQRTPVTPSTSAATVGATGAMTGAPVSLAIADAPRKGKRKGASEQAPSQLFGDPSSQRAEGGEGTARDAVADAAE